MVFKITGHNPEKDEHMLDIKACMLSDAAQLTVKVAGAEASGLYDLKMENAAIMHKAASDLILIPTIIKTLLCTLRLKSKVFAFMNSQAY